MNDSQPGATLKHRKDTLSNHGGSEDNFAGGGNDDTIKPILLRVPRSLLKALRDEASLRDSSINSAIVSILKRYSIWGRLQERLGFMPLHRSMVIQLMDRVDESDMEEIGRIQKDQTIKDFILFSDSNYDFDTFIRWLRVRCMVLGFQLLLREDSDDKGLLIIINHGMGVKWSHYYKGMFEVVLQELLNPNEYKDMKFNLTTSSFSIAILGYTGPTSSFYDRRAQASI